MNALEIKDLHAGYGAADVLRGIGLNVEAGQCVAVLGANGAGKTTLLRTLSGQLPLRRGTITLFGQWLVSYDSAAMARLGIAHVPEGRGTINALTVEENLLVGGYLRSRAEIAEGLATCFAYFPTLSEQRHRNASLLSGGDQQMLAIGRALMLRPRLLLLDEPSFGLAPRIVRSVYDTLARIIVERKISVLLVEQSPELAMTLARRAYLLRNGVVVGEGEAGLLRESTMLRDAYLGGGARA
jgi:branched-chain amino acid transport system ATP-binding protein